MAKTKLPKKPVPPSANGKLKKLPAHHQALMKALVTDDPPADPQILQPAPNVYAEPGIDLRVLVSTNRPDLPYIIELIDVTDPLAPFSVGQLPCPAPLLHGSTRLFAGDLPGAWFVADHLYQIRVSVDPAAAPTPPHGDDAVDVTSVQPIGWFVTKYTETSP
jgi:hypothetical protein